MLEYIIKFSLKNKLIILLFTFSIIGFGIYALLNIPIGAVPDVTNNQVQVITTSRNLSTQDVEQFITYPVELEMANLPGVKEIRSISKFGLSVVTIVFEDRLGTYLPRQLITEKIKKASENIPENFGTPELGPITTGLGEIYQYTLEVDPKYKSEYSVMDLRTIQDWIVKRQLSGIPGIVEINTWGGFLKQYEVQINPDKLRSLNISIVDVFHALEMNNNVTGGGYIEKGKQAFFIRGEGLVSNTEDLQNIVVENRNGLPIYIKDIAEVAFGHATRFGAITGNGEGEKVLGQIMMLKDANSKAVIEAVKERVAEIQNTLPEGISINPFLERSELIEKTTFTIAENLVLGCLIVVFVVVLLLGNIRTGLVVAAVIPLCLLFAISLMYIFGVDANLMSLGAIDFGIIIDGAVIIVEFTAFQITSRRSELLKLQGAPKREFIDKITLEGASKMMHSAIFGQLIIIIVFIPILSLVNVEGKMFKPMAMTFCFALIGAMIFCFTYVPVISSLLLKPTDTAKSNISSKLIDFLQRLYQPVLSWALSNRKTVLGGAVALLLSVGYLFSTLGGEFVPTLDEGDFVIQPVLKTGTSLSETVKTTTQIEKVIKQFPEVKQVVTRIGAAEVPTDPMSMEETDVIISLKPKGEWISTTSKDELADLFKNALVEEIPGVDYEFTQPIEMRFNELITGVRADLAIKIFGEDLKILTQKAQEIEQLIKNVAGASDIIVEKIDGLPQMSVVYDRSKIARYGLNISDVNQVISMGFAGLKAGSVFEGERRFDLVVRHHSDYRKDISHLKNTFVTTSSGQQIPLNELAFINYTKGPAKIARDDTQRRIVVGVNVRNRDLESVVGDVRALIEHSISLPPGYRITYGGQFENLRSARERLTYAVPVALILIFILLHFAFKSTKEALMVYSAIPLSAVGGVLLLWMRGLPFSISAGVGFIALFGIAVLNGIVLIEHFKELKAKGFSDLKALIIEGTVQRLRPVLLTAAAAALGFLPMAISTSAGAEVQRPLATVVIGGLVTATLLTLVVLPVLYYLLEEKTMRINMKPKALVLLIFLLPTLSIAQDSTLTLDEAQQLAKANNASLKASELKIRKSEALVGTAIDIEKTNVYYNYDQNNIAANNNPLKVWGVQQNFQFPTAYDSRKKLKESEVLLSQRAYEIADFLLEKQVSKAYYQILYLQNLEQQYIILDSIYDRFAQAAKRKLELGETDYLERLTAESKQNEIQLELDQVNQDVASAYLELAKWMQSNDNFEIANTALSKIEIIKLDTLDHIGIQYYDGIVSSKELASKLEKSQWLPNLQLEYFRGTNSFSNAQNYNGFQIGLGIPLFYGSQKAKVHASYLEKDRIQLEAQNYKIELQAKLDQLLIDLAKYDKAIQTYKYSGEALADALLHTATRSYESGEIDFFQYIQTMDRGIQIKVAHLKSLQQYNETAIEINYLMN
ncbi:MAG: CusA/CzcA family heavy metal efflux RND transporter [Reichenbachiella sp.]|uniref:CusA/CzcA family heavy metal efflux RND transporter n=1 Tax=Reichenbachiella sp. TaxID=2184521 RepID=UPI003299292A